MERRYYTVRSLLAELRKFEERYGLSTEEFIALRERDEEPWFIPKFDCAVWADTYWEIKRMEEGK